MAGDEELLSVDDKDVFASALSDEPPAEQPAEAEIEAEPKPEGERPRDEQGRFLPKDKEAETPAPAPPLEPLKEQEPQRTPEDAIPSWRLREETQRRREAEQLLAAREAQLQQYLQQARQQQPPEQPPDLIENPAAYAQYVRQQVLQEVRQIELAREQREIKHSLERAGEVHGEEFSKAYQAFNAPALRDDVRLLEQIRDSYDPGEAILKWYRQTEAMREIGTDPKAYRAKVEAELLADPEFRRKYGEALRSQATSRQPSNVTSLPNLTRAPGSAGNSADDWPTTDAGIFSSVTAGLRNR